MSRSQLKRDIAELDEHLDSNREMIFASALLPLNRNPLIQKHILLLVASGFASGLLAGKIGAERLVLLPRQLFYSLSGLL